MKNKIFAFVVCLPIFLFAQSNKNSTLHLGIIAGGSMQTGKQNTLIINGIGISPVIGLELKSDKFPIALNYQIEGNVLPIEAVGDNPNQNFPKNALVYKNFVQSVGIEIHRKKQIFGVKYSNEKITDISNNTSINIKSLQLAYGIPMGNLVTEFNISVPILPLQYPITGQEYRIRFLYHNLFSKMEERNGKNRNGKIIPKLLLGSRFFNASNIQPLNVESEKYGLGIAPTFGVELFVPRFHTSINIERDIWTSLNTTNGHNLNHGGIFNGMMKSTFIGLKYHTKLPNERNIRFGVGASLITDYQYGKEASQEADFDIQNKFSKYQVKGLGVTTSYEIFKNVDVEAKYTIPLSAYKVDSRLFSIGTIVRVGN